MAGSPASLPAVELKTADRARLRRLALGAQGLLQREPFGRGMSGARKAIRHLGYVQIDTISVVERAHHHVFRSRVPNFTADMTNRLLKDRSIFEYWAHAAAFLPMEDFRFSLPYKHRYRSGETHWLRSRDRKLMAELLGRIETEGPLRSRDVEQPKGSSGGWWDWKPAKKALEQLFMEGDLMVTSRDGFEKTYDLTERVLPPGINTSLPTHAEFAEHLLDQQLGCHGAVTLKGITYQRRDADLRKAAKAAVEARLAQGRLMQLRLDGETFLTTPEAWEAKAPRAARSLRILSPFDNAVIQRERLLSLFNYDYQIECYVPEAKRQYGYFCLPILFQDHFIGRVDCKAHRAEGRLELKALHFCEHPFADDELVDALGEALPAFADFQGCERIDVTAVNPTHLQTPLSRKLQTHIEV